MLELSPKQIKEIADLLDAGLICYFNINTQEIKEIIDFDSNEYAEPDDWQEIIDEIDEHYDDYIKFERMSSHESFNIMKEFIDEVEDEKLKNRLVWALSRSHPFQNFKDEIDYNGDYREKWFEFKLGKNIEFVERQILEYNQLEKFKESQAEQGKHED